MLAIIEEAGVEIVRDVDKEAFRARTEPMYEDEEFSGPAVRDLVGRIRAVGPPNTAGGAS